MANLPDLHLAEIAAFNPQPPILSQSWIADVLEIFKENSNTAMGLGYLPAQSSITLDSFFRVLHPVENRTMWWVAGKAVSSAAIKKAILDAAVLEMQRQDQTITQDDWHNTVEDLTQTLGLLSYAMSPQTYRLMQGLLQSIIVTMWAAFEDFTKSLWEATRDSGNSSFKNPTDRERRRDRLWFTSREAIRRTYAFSFDSTFDLTPLNADKIDALALIRNVIIHSAAKADADFLKEVGTFPSLAAVACIQLNQPIPIGGVLARSVIEPVVLSAYALAGEVDRWTTANP